MPPLVRKDGAMQTLDSSLGPLDADAIAGLIHPIMPDTNRGEFRDRHDTDFAYEIAGLARLVFGTLHTTTAASAWTGCSIKFPLDRQAQIRVIPSESLRGVIPQTLCKKVGGGRAAAREVLIVTPAIGNLNRLGLAAKPVPRQTQTVAAPAVRTVARRGPACYIRQVLLKLGHPI